MERRYNTKPLGKTPRERASPDPVQFALQCAAWLKNPHVTYNLQFDPTLTDPYQSWKIDFLFDRIWDGIYAYIDGEEIPGWLAEELLADAVEEALDEAAAEKEEQLAALVDDALGEIDL